MTKLSQVKRIHLIGISGAGMSGIAEVLVNQGYIISGSDMNLGAAAKRLQTLGAIIYNRHAASQVEGADMVVISSAISAENPEVLAAKAQHIPVMLRAEMLAQLMNLKKGIAISGTHGKTTTTSLVASILAEGKCDPTFVIGGLLKSTGVNARLGKSDYFIAEADESDASFLFLHPHIAIVTNIDADHMGTYNNDFGRLQQTFVDFLHQLPFDGLAVLCIDDPVVRHIIPRIPRPIITYGFNEDADYRIVNFMQRGTQSIFSICCAGKTPLSITLNLPGCHYALNAAAAIIVAHTLGVDNAAIIKALADFAGVGRRFQLYGEISTDNGSVFFVDDYGHHPREVEVTLKAARAAWPSRRLVLAYQPHRYTRTQELFTEFVEVLSSLPDVLLLMDVYAAGERPILDANSASLFREIQRRGKNESLLVGELEKLPSILQKTLKDGDVLLTQGAGSIGAMASKLSAVMEKARWE